MKKLRRALAVGAFAGIGLCWPVPVNAEPKTIQGYVVAVQDGDIIVDLAAARGAGEGDIVELWRPLTLRHPVTRKQVSDRFRIGHLVLWQVSHNLAIARIEGELDRPPEAGDVVLLRVKQPDELSKAAVVPNPASGEQAPNSDGDRLKVALSCPVSAADDVSCDGDGDAVIVAQMFEDLRGATISARIRSYESYVRGYPDAPYNTVLREEARLLRQLYRLRTHEEEEPSLVNIDPAKAALAGQPLTIGIELDGDVAGVIVHTRDSGEVTFGSLAMTDRGDGYYSVTLPPAHMNEGKLEYFIEATTPEGSATPIVGTASRPNRLDVRDQPLPEAPEAPRATVAVWTDYADYNRMKGNDTTWQTEGYFGMRFDDVGFRALRTGFGVFRGVGGSIEELEQQQLSPRKVGLTYGYLEGEVAFVSAFALIVRGVVGLNAGGVAGGGQAMLRIGNDLETNLQLGGEFLGGVGLRGIAQFELNMFELVPIMVRTEVTNQPAGTTSNTNIVQPSNASAAPEQTSLQQNDIGARAIAQVGWRIVEPLVIAARGSYQGRTIKHSGPGFGGAVSYTW